MNIFDTIGKTHYVSAKPITCHIFHLNGIAIQILTYLVNKCGFISTVSVFYLYDLFKVTAAMLVHWWDHQIQYHFENKTPKICIRPTLVETGRTVSVEIYHIV